MGWSSGVMQGLSDFYSNPFKLEACDPVADSRSGIGMRVIAIVNYVCRFYLLMKTPITATEIRSCNADDWQAGSKSYTARNTVFPSPVTREQA